MNPQAYSYLRMSTDIQRKGDSRRRQLEASRAYAAANGLDLVEGDELEDIGVSAYRGDNVRDGALGQFLEKVNNGAIKKGSFLIIEALDRLSREQVLTAHSLFLSIVGAGINVVTLSDNRVYRAGSTDLPDLIISLIYQSAAHEESRIKSIRVRAAWENKRSNALAKPMTAICPAWLKLADDRSRYEELPERVEIVRQIFRDTADGVGMYSIANRLNQAGVEAFGSANGWHQSYVAKILANRAVLGEYQAHVLTAGQRSAVGEPIKGYFPAIIDEQLFYRADIAKRGRKKSGAGRKGLGFSNLFSGLARCANCGSMITFENKGSRRKGSPRLGNTYLICDNARRRRGCNALRWRYRDFETSFLAFVEEADVGRIVNSSSQEGELQKIDAELAAYKGELATVDDLMEKTYAVLSGGGPVAFVTSKLNDLATQKKSIEEKLRMKTLERQNLFSRETRYKQSQDEIKELLKQLQRQADAELFLLRTRVAAHLKALIDSLTIASSGERPRLETVLAKARQIDGVDEEVIEHIRRRVQHSDSTRRYFAVAFRDGRVRTVYPTPKNPLQYEQQVTASKTNGIDVAFGESSTSPGGM